MSERIRAKFTAFSNLIFGYEKFLTAEHGPLELQWSVRGVVILAKGERDGAIFLPTFFFTRLTHLRSAS